MKYAGLFSKFMGKTTSSNDNEALMALRRANKMLSDAGLTWEEIARALDKYNDAFPRDAPRRRAPEPDWEGFSPHGHHDDKSEIDTLFEKVMSRSWPASFQQFIDSIYTWWLEKKFLTRKQYRRLKEAAEEMD